MNTNLFASLRTLLAHPDCSDRDALFVVLNDAYASDVLACLAPPGSLAQIAAALRSGWAWDGEGWERQIDELVAMITDPRCSVSEQMITTWRRIPSAVGVLRDRTDILIAWAEERLNPAGYTDLAILLGPSDAAARLLMRSPIWDEKGRTLQHWSMGFDPNDPTAWQAMIESPDLRAALRYGADPSCAFPAWGLDNDVDPETVLRQIVADLINGWSPDHPSIRGQIAWLERHVDANLDDVVHLASLASIAGSDTLADTVCTRLGHDPSSVPRIAGIVPWSRLHPQIQIIIDETMQQASDRWKRTWACALGQAPLVLDTTIDSRLLLWRIAPERWNDLDPSIRAALVWGIIPPNHCYGWGAHPDLVAGKSHPYGQVFRFWNPDVPPNDLRAWAYADRLLKQTSLQDAQEMIALLDTLPPNRRARFEAIIDWRLGGCPEATTQPPWDWAGWGTLPAADRQTRLCARLAVLWGDRDTLPAVRCWRARNDGLATLAMMVGEVLGLDDPPPILAALLAQVLGFRGDETDVGSSLPFPNNLDAALHAQIERLPLARDAQAYAAWGLRVLEQDMGLGSTLIALHPTVAVALAPLLSPAQQEAVAASSATQGWDSMTVMHWAAACATAKKLPMPPIQRRIP